MTKDEVVAKVRVALHDYEAGEAVEALLEYIDESDLTERIYEHIPGEIKMYTCACDQTWSTYLSKSACPNCGTVAVA